MRHAERRCRTSCDTGMTLRRSAASYASAASPQPGVLLRDFSGIPVSRPGDANEREAGRIADAAARATGSLRSFFEPQLERFDDVRVHAGAAPARALGTRAFTAGHDVYIGERALQRGDARRLLAHELAHVVQHERGGEQRIHRAPPDSTGPELGLDDLRALIKTTLDENIALREKLNALPASSSPQHVELNKKLDAGRNRLHDLLTRRIALLKTEISGIVSTLGKEGLSSSADNPGADILGHQLNKYEAELKDHESQLRQIERWKMRTRIASIDEEVSALDAEIAKLPPVSDPSQPEAALKMARRDELMAERKALGKKLTAGAVEYEQFDKRWGSKKYGTSKECSKIAEGGCGPTTLAIVLNQVFGEDPENVRPGPIEFITPDETAAYAETHGRVCGHGTNGVQMVTQLETKWPGYRGMSIKLSEAAGQIRSGNLVIFLCHGCTGKNASGGNKSYKGHFMVLSGVDVKGEVFDVLDPGNRESSDIVTITKTNLASHASGFWIIERK